MRPKHSFKAILIVSGMAFPISAVKGSSFRATVVHFHSAAETTLVVRFRQGTVAKEEVYEKAVRRGPVTRLRSALEEGVVRLNNYKDV